MPHGLGQVCRREEPELTPNLRPLRAAFRKSDQMSKLNTLATHFHTYNLVRKEELIPCLYSQRQTVAKSQGFRCSRNRVICHVWWD